MHVIYAHLLDTPTRLMVLNTQIEHLSAGLHAENVPGALAGRRPNMMKETRTPASKNGKC